MSVYNFKDVEAKWQHKWEETNQYKTDTRDIFAIVYLAALIIYISAGKISGGLNFLYFPAVTPIGRGAYEISLYAAFAFLAAMPIIIEVWEEIRWKHIQSAIWAFVIPRPQKMRLTGLRQKLKRGSFWQYAENRGAANRRFCGT